MPVVGTARELFRGREGGISQFGRSRYRRIFQVKTNDPDDEMALVLGAAGLPGPLEPYPENPSALAIERTARQDDRSWFHWIVEVEYDTAWQRNTSPLEQPPEVQHGSESYEEEVPGVFFEEYTPGEGTRIYSAGLVNSAGEPYEGVKRTKSRPVITFIRNESDSTYSLQKKLLYENSVNSDSWSGLFPRQAYCRSIDAVARRQDNPSDLDNPYKFWEVRYVFVLARETWDLNILDRGTFYLRYPSSGENPPTKVPFQTEVGGQPIFGLLNNTDFDAEHDGIKLEEGQAKAYRRFPIHYQRAFDALDIELALTLDNMLLRNAG